ncbi:putative transcriptional regulator containing an HTH domain fused to a Zn-ribbon [Haloterrigena salina JCM 13891]|uniref:Putative transcriptional regulator containing an HTH domain fused to a Zn-ribbon n=1 Tax=Haloterrigena salina JCM 13891 TaxID=1227488 RepID=M0BQD9_9EURY|nr:transcriptional regulator [Haloterrigena salina]ELZ13130.1 putative transcriptional regulator containing an HTH domain fused to a Zn-ribbon [Haloterrigena salina JCM 13891]
MREADETTRQRLADALRDDLATPSELAVRLDLTPESVVRHAEHVSRSIGGNDADEQLLVAPPTCRDCGFDDFDDLLNLPSRCPSCKSESVTEPTLTIE